jgi:gamma-glutamyltranspeptidase/glutathione hydrolase
MGVGERGYLFFFEKNNQKTFIISRGGLHRRGSMPQMRRRKSFLFRFFKKEVLALLLFSPAALAADPAPVAASKGMVVTAQHLASDVGADILRQGGNAVDAAVAVGYALAVTYPAAGNVGGGGFMTLRLADGRTDFLDFREKAPLAATANMFQDSAGNVVKGLSTSSWLSSGIPGSVLGLETAREKYGTMSRATLMAPAIRLARDGFVLEPGDVQILAVMADYLRKDPATAAIFLKDGAPLVPGDRLRQPELAQSLALISKDGPAAFYHGPVGEKIIAASKAGGGIFTQADFDAYKVRALRPIECDYRGYHVISSPPPSSGGVTLCEMLGILQGYDLHAMGFHSADEVHVLAETMRRAYRDRNNRLGDPDFVQNPVAELTDPAYEAKLRATIDPERATPSASLKPAPHEGHNTTQYSIVDKEGNAVSVTYTLNEWFGSGHVAPGTGIVMNDEMDDFSSKPGVPNMFGLIQGANDAIAPGKTPLSSMTPTILTRNGKLVMVVGSPGGSRIITIVLEAIINVIDHGMTVQEAIDAPRIHEQFMPDTVLLERGALSPDTRRILQQRGYHFTDGMRWGLAEAILTGAPSLGALHPGDDENALPLGTIGVPGATLFGAHDVRGGAGKAAGVD